MFRKLIYALCMISGLAFLNSCDKVAKGDQTLDLLDDRGKRASTVAFVDPAGGSQTLHLVSNTSWKISVPSTADWLTVSPTKGKDDKDITFTVTGNESYVTRKAVVSLSVDGKAGSMKVSVEQEGMENPNPPIPESVILDVKFNADGTAEDISDKQNKIETIPGSNLVTYYNESTGGYVAHFNNTPGGSSSTGYYRVDAPVDSDLWKALADGHSMEILVRYDSKYADFDKEVKPFSAMEAGGVGFLIAKSNNGQELTYLPNISADGKSKWIWTKTGVAPSLGTYYHLVGVWDKEANKSIVYLNGKKAGEVDTNGNLNPAKDGCRWFCIGGDAGPSGAQAIWNGDIAIARIYDNALEESDVETLYKRVRNYNLPVSDIALSNVIVVGMMDVKAGSQYIVAGSGFKSGDKLVFQSPYSDYKCELDCAVTDQMVATQIPADMASDTYKVLLKRGEILYPLGTTKLTVTEDAPALKSPKIIAHRGYHAKAPENSVAAVEAAQALGIYGAEIDVWMTTDGEIVVNHDEKIDGKSIQNSTYDQIKDIKLSNGESLPKLSDMLDLLSKNTAMKLIIEIKTHSSEEKQTAATQAVVSAVQQKGLGDHVEYIAFSYETCAGIVASGPTAIVSYLGGDKTPAELAKSHISGLDYQLKIFKNNPSWIREAHAAGLTVNMWTLNNNSDMVNGIAMGADYITTDKPEELKALSDAFFNK